MIYRNEPPTGGLAGGKKVTVQGLSGTNYSTYNPPSFAAIENALFYISPNLARNEWARVGMSLHHELGEAGFSLFDQWSQGGGNYSLQDTKSTWRSVRCIHGVTIRTLFWMAKQHGYQGGEEPISTTELIERTKHRETEKKRQAQKEDWRRKKAARYNESLISGSWPLSQYSDTPAHRYLLNRLSSHSLPPLSDDLRYHSSLEYRHSDDRTEAFPALLGVVRNLFGNVCSIHRTYLTEEGMKAEVSTPKKLTPVGDYTVTGAGIHCCGDIKSNRIVLAEGVENALALSVALNIPGVAAVSAHGLGSYKPRKETRMIYIGADNDTSGTGQKAAERLKEQLMPLGVPCKILTPFKAGTDWCDVLQEGGL